jgi:hypothetical protein
MRLSRAEGAACQKTKPHHQAAGGGERTALRGRYICANDVNAKRALVMAGLDPAIHDEGLYALTVRMDHRVKPGDDESSNVIPDAR